MQGALFVITLCFSDLNMCEKGYKFLETTVICLFEIKTLSTTCLKALFDVILVCFPQQNWSTVRFSFLLTCYRLIGTRLNYILCDFGEDHFPFFSGTSCTDCDLALIFVLHPPEVGRKTEALSRAINGLRMIYNDSYKIILIWYRLTRQFSSTNLGFPP